MEIETRHDPQNLRFVVDLDGGEATLQYAHAGTKTLDYKSTFVPQTQRKRGIGERLVLDALEWARTNDYSVIPSCPFVRAVVERNSEYRDIVVSQD